MFWKVSGGSIEDFLGIFGESEGFLVFSGFLEDPLRILWDFLRILKVLEGL